MVTANAWTSFVDRAEAGLPIEEPARRPVMLVLSMTENDLARIFPLLREASPRRFLVDPEVSGQPSDVPRLDLDPWVCAAKGRAVEAVVEDWKGLAHGWLMDGGVGMGSAGSYQWLGDMASVRVPA